MFKVIKNFEVRNNQRGDELDPSVVRAHPAQKCQTPGWLAQPAPNPALPSSKVR